MCTVSVIYRPEHVQESSCVLFKVNLEEMDFHSCLNDTDCCSRSNTVCVCIPDLCCDSTISLFVN